MLPSRPVIGALVGAALFVCVLFAAPGFGLAEAKGFTTGKPDIQSMSTLEFGIDGILFVGDSRAGAIYAIDTGDRTAIDSEEQLKVEDLEGKLAELLGTTSDEIMIHDLAVNPASQNVYITVSRGRSGWSSKWQLPNDLEDARILMRITPDATIEEVSLDEVSFAMVQLPNPVSADKMHRWKEGTSQRVDAVTDIVYDDGTLYVAGLSNEEFAAALWQIPYPFESDATFSTLEIFHGAHGKYETYAPIRTFLPYELDGQRYILASYLCTPLVTFALNDLEDRQHVKGNTVAEFGSGNYPLDMVLTRHGDKEFIVMANSMLPLMTFDPRDVGDQTPITEEPPSYTAGVSYVPKSGSGIQQLDSYNSKYMVALQRQPNGKLDLVALSLEWLAY